jgi:hypothetical protein
MEHRRKTSQARAISRSDLSLKAAAGSNTNADERAGGGGDEEEAGCVLEMGREEKCLRMEGVVVAGAMTAAARRSMRSGVRRK